MGIIVFFIFNPYKSREKYQYMETCSECGAPMHLVGDIKNTRLLMCTECFAEKHQFISDKKCNHEFNDKNECAHCGISK